MRYDIKEFAKLNNVEIKTIEDMEAHGYFNHVETENGTKIYSDNQMTAFKLAYDNFCLKGLDKVAIKEFKTEFYEIEEQDYGPEFSREERSSEVFQTGKEEEELEEGFQNREEYYEDLEAKQQEIIDKITAAYKKKEKKEKEHQKKRKKEERAHVERKRLENEIFRERSIQEEQNNVEESIRQTKSETSQIGESAYKANEQAKSNERQGEFLIRTQEPSKKEELLNQADTERKSSNLYKDIIETDKKENEKLRYEKLQKRDDGEKSHSTNFGNLPDEKEEKLQKEKENRERIKKTKHEIPNHFGGAKVGKGHLLKDIDYSINRSQENEPENNTTNVIDTSIKTPDYKNLYSSTKEETIKKETTTLYNTGSKLPDESSNIKKYRVSALNNAALYKMEDLASKKRHKSINSFENPTQENVNHAERVRLNSTTNLRHDAIAASLERGYGETTGIMSISGSSNGNGKKMGLEINETIHSLKSTNGRFRTVIGKSYISFYGFKETAPWAVSRKISVATEPVMSIASRRGINARYSSLLAASSRISDKKLEDISNILKAHHLAGKSFKMALNSRGNTREALKGLNAYASQRGFGNISRLSKKDFERLMQKNKNRMTLHDVAIMTFYKEHMMKLSETEMMLSKNKATLKNGNRIMMRHIFGKLDQYHVVITVKNFGETGLSAAKLAMKVSKAAQRGLKSIPNARLRHVINKHNKQNLKLKKITQNQTYNINKIRTVRDKRKKLSDKRTRLQNKVNGRKLKDAAKRANKLRKREKSFSGKARRKLGGVNSRFKKLGITFKKTKIGKAFSGAGKILNTPFRAFNAISMAVNKIKMKLLFFLGIGILFVCAAAINIQIIAIVLTNVTGFFMKTDGSKADTIEETAVYEIIEESNNLNSNWINWLYGLKNELTPPEDSYETQAITMHDGKTKDAAVLNGYKDIEVHFVDSFATRTPISVINNTKQIICMASVYFENDLSSDDANSYMIEYVTQLWKDSHMPNEDVDVASKYGIYYETSSVYYCDGCETYYCDGSAEKYWDPGTKTWVNGTCEGEIYCPGHVDVNVYATVYGFDAEGGNEGTTMFDVDSYAENNGGKNWKGWGEKEGNKEWAEILYDQDWKELYDVDIDSLCVWDTQYVSSGNGSRLSDGDLSLFLGYSGGNDIVAYALSRMGYVTYVYGAGHGSNYKTSNLLDCSSFVCQVLSNTGHDIGIMSTSGLASAGTGVSQSDIQPGDVVVRRSGTSGHTGIYIGRDGNGNYLVVHNSGTGINVIVSSYPNLNSWNYIRRIR